MITQEEAIKKTLSDGIDLRIWGGQWNASELKSFAEAARGGKSNLGISDYSHLGTEEMKKISEAGGFHVSFYDN